MKKLFATDLDGTLLTSQQTLSPYTQQVISRGVAEGMLFTVATARKKESTLALLGDLPLSAPMVLANGAFVYDKSAQTYLHWESLPHSRAEGLIQIIGEFPVTCRMCIFDGKNPLNISQFPPQPASGEATHTHYTQNLAEGLSMGEVVSFVIIGGFPELEPLCRIVQKDPTLWSCCYENIYHSGEFWLEIYSQKVSKAQGLQFVKEYLGVSYLVAFGDNLNDLEMLLSAEEGYCVANALQCVKEQVGKVLPHTNNQDAVANFLESTQGGYYA